MTLSMCTCLLSCLLAVQLHGVAQCLDQTLAIMLCCSLPHKECVRSNGLHCASFPLSILYCIGINIQAVAIQEMASAFHTQGAMPPPWRQAKAMLSKWLPSKSRDLLLAANVPASPTSSEGPSSFRDSASYLFNSSSPISTLAPWRSASPPSSSLPALSSRPPHPRPALSRKSSDSVRLKSALSSDLAALNSAKSRQHATGDRAAKPDPVQNLSLLPGMERIFTVKMQGWRT